MSGLRTILVSTTYQDEKTKQLEKLFQGRTTLKSHTIGDKNYDFKGYLGEGEFRAVSQLDKEHKWLDHGSETGTTIRVLGWMPPPLWREILIGYAISTYFSAILKGNLSLKVGKLSLNKDNFHGYLSNKDFLAAIEKNDPECFDEIELASWFAKCLTGEKDVIEDTSQVIGLGKSQIKMLVDEKAPWRFGILRNDILITSQLEEFYKVRQPTINHFVGLYECIDEDGSKLLRRMEPPQHDKFRSDLLYEGDREKGKNALRNLGNTLKNLVKKHAQKDITEGNDIPWLTELADIGGDGQDPDESDDIDPSGILEFTPKPRKPPKPKELWKIEKPVKPRPPTPTPPTPTPPKPGPKPPQPSPDDDETETVNTSDAIGVHSRYISGSNTSGKIICRSEKTGSHVIKFFEVGADFTEEIKVKSLQNSIINGESLIIDLKDEKTVLNVAFDREVLGGIKVLLRKE